MPKKPTGRPRGRQLGSGTLGLGTADDHARLTLRIPRALYETLTTFSEGRGYHRGARVHLADTVRKAIAHYVLCPNRRQTSNIPHTPVHELWQTSNMPPPTTAVPPPATATPPTPAMPTVVPVPTDTPPLIPAFDASKFVLTPLCENKHDYKGTGQSLRRLTDNACKECDAARQRKRRTKQAKVMA